MLLRSKNYGCYTAIESPAWGMYLRPVPDPDGVDVSLEELRSFELRQNFPRLPHLLLNKIVSFFVQFSIESQVVLIRKESDDSVWDALVPRQQNTTGTVSADKTQMISLTTEREYDFIPDGWYEAGTAHSHPNMMAFWSAIDDKSELNAPGLHFTVGGDWKTRRFTICTSICLAGTRHVLAPHEVIEGKFTLEKPKGVSYTIDSFRLQAISNKVKAYVKQQVFKPFVRTKPQTNFPYVNSDFYTDPFGYLDDPQSSRYTTYRELYLGENTKKKEKYIEDIENTIISMLLDGYGDFDDVQQIVDDLRIEFEGYLDPVIDEELINVEF